MSFRSHIFKRCSRSFNSCSLVLRSLSSLFSLSSVASISHLQETAAGETFHLYTNVKNGPSYTTLFLSNKDINLRYNYPRCSEMKDKTMHLLRTTVFIHILIVWCGCVVLFCFIRLSWPTFCHYFKFDSIWWQIHLSLTPSIFVWESVVAARGQIGFFHNWNHEYLQSRRMLLYKNFETDSEMEFSSSGL